MSRTTTIWSEKEKSAWQLPEEGTVSQWADENRILPEFTAEPGLYRTSLTPYMRGPMDAFGESEVEEIDLVFASQMGKSTALQNMVGYAIDQDPGDAQYTVPREKDVGYVSRRVFSKMVELSPALQRHLTGSPRDIQTEFFEFNRMALFFAWSGSPAEMAQKAVKYLFLDETDKYPLFAGKEAGPIDLAVKRVRTFWDAKIVKTSTPVQKTGHIWSSYEKSNRQQYYIPCPHCGEYSVWKFAQLRIAKELRDPERIREMPGCVRYECEHCGKPTTEDMKEELVAEGVWLPEGQQIDANGNIKGKALRGRRHSGFQASALIAPFPKVSWPNIMADWFEATTQQGIAEGKLLDFQNSTLGEPYQETGKKTRASEVRKLTGGFSRGTVPAECLVLVASADYHKSLIKKIVTIVYEVRGFGYGMQNQVISSGIIHSFDELDKEVLLSPFPWSDGTVNEEKPWPAVMALFVDAGYEPDDVYEYCRQRPGLTIPTKGEEGPCLKPLRPSDLESATERRLTARHRARYRGMQLMLVDTFYFKNQVTSWVEAKTDEDGRVIAEPLTRFYDEVPSYYFTEFTNEQKVQVRDKRGNLKWAWRSVTKEAPVHSLDTAVLCAAAGYYKGVQYLRSPEEAEKKRRAAAMAQVRPARKKRRPRGDGFLDNLPRLM